MDITDNEINQLTKLGGGLKQNILFKKKLITFIHYDYRGFTLSQKDKETQDYIIKNSLSYCQGKINPKYVKQMFNISGIHGIIAEFRGQYLGFILFKPLQNTQNTLDFKLLCAISKTDLPERSGIPIGKILLQEMEKYAKNNGYNKIVAR